MRIREIVKIIRRHTGMAGARIAAAVLWLAILMAAAAGAVVPEDAYAAAQWPVMSSIEAEGGILIDARTGTVLFAKNENQQFYPASITKILTALLVIENCSNLDEEFEFSHRAVYDVESNSQNCGYDEGDVISVRDALYAMLLQSANEVANGLAEHVGGSIEGFADMMNEYAASVGCTNSHFANPSGLNNPEHYTTAADYAKICRKAFENEIFREIDGTLYYKLPPSKRNPDGLTVYTHHGMLKKNNENYYADAIGGKTGYTSLAGNTLVTCAERDGLRLITVVLNGHKTHYSDTRSMLNFGFDSFRSLSIRDHERNYADVYDVLDITSEGVDGADILTAQTDASVILPKDADFSDLTATMSYKSTNGDFAAGGSDTDAPEGAVARISYMYEGREVGVDYLTADLTQPEITETEQSEAEQTQQAASGDSDDTQTAGKRPIWHTILIVIGVLALIAAATALVIYVMKRRSDMDMIVPGMGSRSGGRITGPGESDGIGRIRGRSRRKRR